MKKKQMRFNALMASILLVAACSKQLETPPRNNLDWKPVVPPFTAKPKIVVVTYDVPVGYTKSPPSEGVPTNIVMQHFAMTNMILNAGKERFFSVPWTKSDRHPWSLVEIDTNRTYRFFLEGLARSPVYGDDYSITRIEDGKELIYERK